MNQHELEWHVAPRQGRHPSCWLIAVLAAVWRSDRTRLEKLVKKLPCGRYEVALPGGTLWLWPTFPSWSAQPLFCALIEKAVAYIRGGYHNMGPATIHCACQILFGCAYRVNTGTGLPIAVLGSRGGRDAFDFMCSSIGSAPTIKMGWKGPLRRGLRTVGDVTGGALAMYGTAKGVAAMSSELYAGFNAARGFMTAASMVAPLAVL
jgi:hypothetical protein